MRAQDRIRDGKLPGVAILALFVAHMAIGLLGWDFTVEADGREYLQIAQNILDHGLFSYDGIHPVVGKPPGFSFLIAAHLWLTGSLQGFQWLQLIFMFLAFVFIARTVARWLGWTGGLVLLGLMVAAWPLHRLTSHLLAEAPFLALTSAGMYLTVRASGSKRLLIGALAGVAFGVSTYFRPVNLLWPIAILLFVVIWQRRQLRMAVVVCVVHVMVIMPWICRNWLQFDRAVPMVANWAPLYYMTEPDLWEIYFFQGSGVIRASEDYSKIVDSEFQFNWGPSERFRRAALENISRDPLGYAGRCVRQSSFIWTYVPGTKRVYVHAPVWFHFGRAAMLVFYLFTVIGAIGLLRSRQPLAGLPAAYAAYTALILFPVCTESRYLIPAYLWLLPYTIAGIVAAWHFVKARRCREERKR